MKTKGYTYGIYSDFSGSTFKGPFTVASSVRSNVTYESISLIKDIIENYGNTYNENDLETTKGFMIKSNARAFETINAKLNILNNISKYGLANDYIKNNETIVKTMTIEDIKLLAKNYLDVNKMYYLIVGDATTQLQKLDALGFGKPILLN